MRGHPIHYLEEEMAWLEANHGLPITQYHTEFCEAFGRNDISKSALNSLRKRKGWSTGRTGRFKPGHRSWNQGKPFPSRGRSAETQFRPGQLSGKAAEIRKPIGTERRSKEGYLERKINDDLPYQRRWKAVHRINWEAVNGPVPEGHALKCLDGNKLNVAPSNWQLISRGMLPLLNGGRNKTSLAFDDAAPEVKPVVMALAKLKQRAKALAER